MRFGFQARPWDLFLILAYTTAVAAAILLVGAGSPVAALSLLFAPGYVLVAALFPRNDSLDWAFRLVLSVGVSFALVPLLILLLDFTPPGIRLPSIVGVLVLFTVSVGLLAYWRRIRVPPEERLGLRLESPQLRWKEDRPVDKALTVALVASVTFMAFALTYVAFVPRIPDRYTEFYLLGSNGTVGDYPSRLNVSEQGQVSLGLVNHEGETTAYTLFVDLVGVRIVFNETNGYNETSELNRTTWQRFDVALGDGEAWQRPYPFSVNASGTWKLEFLLYRGGTSDATPYKSVHLILRVGSP